MKRIKRIHDTNALCLLVAMGVAALAGRPVAGTAQTVTNLHSFGAFASDGQNPVASVIAVGSTLYGTTSAGGGNGSYGTVFAVNTDGSGPTNLHQFGAAGDGRIPRASLVLGDSNTLYGTTTEGGTNNNGGVIFSINTDGSDYMILHEFGGAGDGRTPQAALTLVGSTLYGTTYGGGANFEGTVFAINTDGSGYTVLYQFGTTVANDGANPWAPLTAVGSTLYGTTYGGGGPGNKGTVFAIETNGSNYTVLYRLGFNNDGANPQAPLLVMDSLIYGTTYYGGMIGQGTVFAMSTDGSSYTNLHQFNISGYDGQYPWGLTLVGSNLFGTTYAGGSNSAYGIVFSINTNGTGYKTVHQFDALGNHARTPLAGLTLVGSALYGTTYGGGNNGAGTFFKLTLPALTNGNNGADLSISKTDSPDPVTVGSNLTYTVTVTNKGPAAASGVFLTDTLPSSTTFVSASPGCTNNGGTITCGVGDLANGGSVSVQIVVTPTATGSITNSVAVAAEEDDPSLGNNTATATTAVNAGGQPGGSLTGTLSGVKQKCKTKNNVTTCSLGAALALLNSGNADAPATHVRFVLSEDEDYDAGEDAQIGEATTKIIKVGKAGKAKLKTSTGASSSGLFILAVDDEDNVLALVTVPAI